MAAVAAWVFILLMLAACGTPQRSGELGFRSGVHTVRHHETLYAIAWRYGLEWQDLARWNNIDEPYTIYPGQRLRMNPPPGDRQRTVAQAPPAQRGGTPRETRNEPPPVQQPRPVERQAERPPAQQSRPAESRAQTSAPARSSEDRPQARPSPPASSPPPTQRSTAPSGAIDWRWPTDGEVIRSFPASGTGKRGIAISGQPGQSVRAAAPGRVVYSGSGLVGYGKLIIVKHDDTYLSAYAHNEKILVNEGAEVSQGQEIALLGDTGTDRPMLHFEIRKDGRPVDPSSYLPSR
ncbi:peptidoglycan DD-metalloendopeptidase family protein [Ectothiorhodospira variabilis]|uniref:peptidoglycan DD-metalloendopeptidase family protein n=1 Tax=Ectothiorhodospira variabilis TaxID=505694 RepID=UPI001EFC1F07|nr:peptidoglycan DD-metalloendopeptidase family protein [Ectothiorhodospira variabilis]MCG5497852.1 peptidoglycan DD-metalloendopeptidase family protein [Ectothiorhodospira variabilis]